MGNLTFTRVLITITFVLSMAFMAIAQGTTSRVTGTVTDNTGAVVTGATVTLIGEGTTRGLTTITNNSGVYLFDLIQPGVYTLTVEKEGFNRFESVRNTVLLNIPATINVTLAVGDVSVVVSVEGTVDLVQTATSGNVGTTLETRQIEALPIVGARGRNPFDLLNYQPGVSRGSNTGGGIHVHGSRDRAFNFTLDGIDINESTAGGSNFTPLRANTDSIRELQITTSNFTAELGRSSGAQVSMTTRSGTNRFSGNIFEYYQTPELIANEWEFNKQGIAKRQFVQHIFGGSFGGPIPNPFGNNDNAFRLLKDRAFFFVNLQMLRASETRLATPLVYTPMARAGILRYVQGNVYRGCNPGEPNCFAVPGRNANAGTAASATFPTGAAVNPDGTPRYPYCGIGVPEPCIQTYDATTGRPITVDPLIMTMLGNLPGPNDYINAGDGLNTARLGFVAPQNERQYDFVTRVDFKFNDNHQFYVRYAKGEQNTFGDIANSGLQRFPGYPNWIDTFRNPENLAANWRWSPNARFTNEFIFGVNRFGFKFEYPAANSNVPFILNTVTDPDRNFAYNARRSRTYQFVNNMTYDLSPHTLKFGVNFRLGNQVDDRSSAGGQIEPQVGFGTGSSNFTGWGVPNLAVTGNSGNPAGVSGIHSTDRALILAGINNYIGRIGSYSQGFVVSPDNPNEWAPAGTRWIYHATYPEYDFYFQDTWRMARNFTVDLGLRWEVKMSPGSKGLPVLTPSQPFGIGAAPTNALRWEEGPLYDNDWNNFSPSVGFAWDPFGDGKTSIRTNYRLSYDRFASQLFANFVYQSAPGNTTASSFVGVGNLNLLIRNGLPNLTPTQTPDQLRQPVPFSTTSIVTVDPDIQFPESHAWFAGFQRDLWKGNVLEVNYIGRRGLHLMGAYDRNQVNILATAHGQTFLDAFNLVRADWIANGANNPTYFSPLINALFTGDPNNNAGTLAFRGLAAVQTTLAGGATGGSVANAALAVSQHVTSGAQTIGRPGFFNNPYFFQDYPQFSGALNVVETNGRSMYHGLEVITKKRFSRGFSYQLAYTYSVSKDDRSWDPTFATANRGAAQSASSTPFDINNRSLNYSWSDFDRRHAIQSFFVWELPFGRGQAFGRDIARPVDWIIGGWQLSGLVNIASGRPYTFYSGVNTFSNAVQSTVNCNGCSRNMGSYVEPNGIPVWLTTAQLGQLSQPEPGELGGTPRNFFIGPRQTDIDASLSKKFRFNERWSFDLRVDAKNVFNIKTFGLSDAAMTFTSASAGQINNSVLSFSRRVQISGKLNF